MSPTKQELRVRWLVWTNGLIHAGWSAFWTGLGTALVLTPLETFKIITPESMWVAWGAAVVSGVANGVVGYMKQSPIPDVFAVPTGDLPTIPPENK